MKKQNLLVLGLVVSMFTWGLSWPSGKILSTYGSASAIAGYRFLLTFLSLLPILIIFRQPLVLKKEGYLTLAGAGICMSLYSFLFFNGLKHGKPGAGGVLVTTLNPVISYLFGMLIYRRRPDKNEITGLVAGTIAGIVLLKAWDNTHSVFDSGNIYFLLASATWAILSMFTSRSGLYGSSVSFSLWMYLICTVFMFSLTGFATVITLFKATDLIFWLNMIFSAVITTTFATSFYFYATSQIGAEKASSFIFLVPLSAAVSSFLIFGEKIQWNTMAGGCLGTFAVFMLNRK